MVLLSQANRMCNSVYWISFLTAVSSADTGSPSLGIRGVYRGSVCRIVVVALWEMSSYDVTPTPPPKTAAWPCRGCLRALLSNYTE